MMKSGERPVEPPSTQLWDRMRDEWLHLIDSARSRIAHCAFQLSEEQLWWRPFEGGNSVANHIIHICGNLKQWIVNGVPGTSSTRDRAAEFSVTAGKSRAQLLTELDAVLSEVRGVLRNLSPDAVFRELEIQGFRVSVLGAITHSIPHLVGHTHQIMLTTRLKLGHQYQFQWTPEGDRSTVPI